MGRIKSKELKQELLDAALELLKNRDLSKLL